MNERIKQLADQAEQYADDTMNSDPAKYDRPGQVKVWRELMQAKFAELIVRECAEICKKQEYKYWRSSEEDQWTPIDSANAIEQHFGVE